MRIWLGLLLTMILAVLASGCVTYDCLRPPVLDSATLAVQTVRYGAMPLQTRTSGAISHVHRSQASIQVPGNTAQLLKTGQSASVKIAGIGNWRSAHVTYIRKAASNELATIELFFVQPLPPSIGNGDSADILIDNGKIENTLYMERGLFNTENVDAPVFRRNARTATQVTVHFGIIAGDLIEIKSGLHEGDQVIVSDMSRYVAQNQVLLE